MTRREVVLSADKGLPSFVRNVEADLAKRKNYADMYARYEAYYKSLGGAPITSMPLPEGTGAVAWLDPALNKCGFFKPVDNQQPFTATCLSRLSL